MRHNLGTSDRMSRYYLEISAHEIGNQYLIINYPEGKINQLI